MQLERAGDAREPGDRGFEVVDQRDPEVGRARVETGRVGPREIAAGQGDHPGMAPDGARRRLAVADIEPQEEPAARPVETVIRAEDPGGRVELGAIERAV